MARRKYEKWGPKIKIKTQNKQKWPKTAENEEKEETKVEDNVYKAQEKQKKEEIFNKLAGQLKGQIYSVLPQHGYRLRIYAPYYEGNRPTYGKMENGIRLYPMPDFKTAILVMDVLFSEYKLLKLDWVNIWLEWLDPKTGEWEEWEDSEGNSFKEYYLDENYVPHPSSGEDDDE